MELLEEIQKIINDSTEIHIIVGKNSFWKDGLWYFLTMKNQEWEMYMKKFNANTLPDYLAETYIWLVENKFISFQK